MKPLSSPFTIIISCRRKMGRSAFTTTTATREEALRDEAKSLTLALYRTCLRSVRLIRHGNALDEAEFKRREEERFGMLDTSRTNMLSMLPPVDRQDELRSRAEYYEQYTRENFVQESGCLEGTWHEQRIARYLYDLRRGEHQRTWLLKDMGFEDPYAGWMEMRVEQFERNARAVQPNVLTTTSHVEADDDREEEEDDAYAWSDDEEEEERLLPGWYKNARSGGGL